MTRISKNGVHMVVVRDNQHKRPVLGIMFDDESRVYKVATFSHEDKADWFYNVIKENWIEEGNNDERTG